MNREVNEHVLILRCKTTDKIILATMLLESQVQVHTVCHSDKQETKNTWRSNFLKVHHKANKGKLSISNFFLEWKAVREFKHLLRTFQVTVRQLMRKPCTQHGLSLEQHLQLLQRWSDLRSPPPQEWHFILFPGKPMAFL